MTLNYITFTKVGLDYLLQVWRMNVIAMFKTVGIWDIQSWPNPEQRHYKKSVRIYFSSSTY